MACSWQGQLGGGKLRVVCVCIYTCMCELHGGGDGGVVLHLKFHNICSIGRAIYTTEAGVLTGNHCNWGVGVYMCVGMCAFCA